MAQEVDMVDAQASKVDIKTADIPEIASVSVQLAAMEAVIDKAVRAKEPRTPFNRVLRQLSGVRKRMQVEDVRAFITSRIPEASGARILLLAALEQMETPMNASDGAAEQTAVVGSPPPAALPEVEALACLLAVSLLVDAKRYTEASAAASGSLDYLASYNRRTLDVLSARLSQLLALAASRGGSPAGPALRARLLSAHQVAALRLDEIGQETLLNLVLASFLSEGLFEQADALRARAPRPDQSRSVAQQARYLFHCGRIQAVKLDYSEARESFQTALRKAPLSARGFRLAVTKWLTVVRLLLGEPVERDELAAGDLAPGLAPYLALTRAVRVGDLAAFAAVVTRHREALARDRLLALVSRLRHSVIRQGLRRISAAYARIGLADVADRLGLASPGDAEAVAAKAIRDGSILARVDHDRGELVAGSAKDAYATSEPAAVFHARIAFCMDVHNEAVKAMRYEALAALQLDDADKQRERMELELHAALEDEGMDF